MNPIDYIMSRVTLFFIICIIWLFLNERLHVQVESLRQEPSVENAAESNESPGMNNLRPVNLMIINDKSNRIANESIVLALKRMATSHPNTVGKVITIEVYGNDPKEDLKRICDIWDTVVNEESSNVPDLVLDTTKSGYAAETVSAFTAAVGVPTLSAQYGREGDMKNWNFHNISQYKHLVQIIPSLDLISEAAKQFAHQMNITSAAVIFDEEFNMDYRYKDFFDNSKTRFVVVPIKTTAKAIRGLLFRLRELDIINFFIFGSPSTIRFVLNAGCPRTFYDPYYGWYVFTQYNETLKINCQEVPIITMIPMKSEKVRKLEENIGIRELPIEPMLTSTFYYDFARLGITAMKESILKGKWPVTNLEYLTCKAFNGTNTPNINFDYYSELVEASDVSKLFSHFASFVWGGRNGRNYATFDMIAEKVLVDYNEIENSTEVATWPGEWLSPFKIKNEPEINKQAGRIRYRITTVLKKPFVMYNEETKVFSGYCIDLLKKIASKLNFTYIIFKETDPEFGREENGRWNGSIGELLLKKADIALGAFPVMAEKATVIDYTVPYYDLVGFSILMRKPKRPTHLFKFLNVFANEVWLSILGSLFVTSILLAIFNRWSPYSYRHNLEKYKDDDEKRDFTLRESLWFTLTSLTPQGAGIAPKNLSGRLLSATWWLFGFVIIASYSANLAAFLAISRLETMVESLDDLSKQHRIEYAPIIYSEAYWYFKRMSDIESHFYDVWKDLTLSTSISELERSKLGVYQYPLSYKFTKMFQTMIDGEFPRDIAEALQRVRGESKHTAEFALIGDATDIRYLAMTNCDLEEIGSEFSRKPYALAVQKGSPLRESLNKAILELLNERELEKLKNKWWKDNPDQVQCEEPELLSDGISMANIGGAFLFTFTGIGVAIITLICEYYWYRVLRPSKRNVNR